MRARRPSVALTPTLVYVAWVEEDGALGKLSAPEIRFAWRPRTGGAWTFSRLDGFTAIQSFAQIGLAYEADTNRVYVSYREDAGGTSGVGRINSFIMDNGSTYGTGPISELSKPVCTGSSNCLLQKTKIQGSSQCLSLDKGHLVGQSFVYDADSTNCISSYGLIDLTGSNNYGLVGTLAQSAGNSWVYTKYDWQSAPGEWRSFNTHHWPISVGEQGTWSFCGPPQYFCPTRTFRLAVPRP